MGPEWILCFFLFGLKIKEKCFIEKEGKLVAVGIADVGIGKSCDLMGDLLVNIVVLVCIIRVMWLIKRGVMVGEKNESIMGQFHSGKRYKSTLVIGSVPGFYSTTLHRGTDLIVVIGDWRKIDVRFE